MMMLVLNLDMYVCTPGMRNLAKYTQLGSNMDGEFVLDYSGYSVSLSSDVSVLAIGAICNDCNGANSEHVHVYCWDVGLAKKYTQHSMRI